MPKLRRLPSAGAVQSADAARDATIATATIRRRGSRRRRRAVVFARAGVNQRENVVCARASPIHLILSSEETPWIVPGGASFGARSSHARP